MSLGLESELLKRVSSGCEGSKLRSGFLLGMGSAREVSGGDLERSSVLVKLFGRPFIIIIFMDETFFGKGDREGRAERVGGEGDGAKEGSRRCRCILLVF